MGKKTKFTSSKAAEYRKTLQENFSEELDCKVPDRLFERLYHDASLAGWPDPDDLVCEFEAYEYNNSHIEGRISCLESFLTTRQANYKMKRDKERHESLMKNALNKQLKSVNKEVQEIQSGLENLKTKTIKKMQTANSDLKGQVIRLKAELASLRKKIRILPELEKTTKSFREANHKLVEENKRLKILLDNSYNKKQMQGILKDLREKCKADMDQKLERGLNKLRMELGGFLDVHSSPPPSPQRKPEPSKKYAQSPKYTEPIIVNLFNEPKPRPKRRSQPSKAKKRKADRKSGLYKDTVVSKTRRRKSLDRIHKLKKDNDELKRLGKFQFGSTELGKSSGRASRILKATMKSRKRNLESASLPSKKRLKLESTKNEKERRKSRKMLASEIEELMKYEGKKKRKKRSAGSSSANSQWKPDSSPGEGTSSDLPKNAELPDSHNDTSETPSTVSIVQEDVANAGDESKQIRDALSEPPRISPKKSRDQISTGVESLLSAETTDQINNGIESPLSDKNTIHNNANSNVKFVDMEIEENNAEKVNLNEDLLEKKVLLSPEKTVTMSHELQPSSHSKDNVVHMDVEEKNVEKTVQVKDVPLTQQTNVDTVPLVEDKEAEETNADMKLSEEKSIDTEPVQEKSDQKVLSDMEQKSFLDKEGSNAHDIKTTLSTDNEQKPSYNKEKVDAHDIFADTKIAMSNFQPQTSFTSNGGDSDDDFFRNLASEKSLVDDFDDLEDDSSADKGGTEDSKENFENLLSSLRL